MNNFAMVFPGQGSQYVGMLSDFLGSYPEILETFESASSILGYDLWNYSQTESIEKISETEVTQPLMLTAGIALLNLWESLGGKRPSIVAGHSLGEYTALVAAKTLSFDDAIHLVRNRGRLMQSAVPQGIGGMGAVIGLNDAKVVEICRQISLEMDGVLEAVNFNAPRQVVIAGHSKLLVQSVLRFKAAGARKVVILPVSAPFHSRLMEKVEKQLSEFLRKIVFSPPSMPVIQALGKNPESDPGKIYLNLVRQVSKPVPWVTMVKQLSEFGINNVFEVGPGNVLCGLIKRIDPSITCKAIGKIELFNDSLLNVREVS